MLRSCPKFQNLAARLANVTRIVVKASSAFAGCARDGRRVIETNRSVVIVEGFLVWQTQV
jgi:hypothetical protein